MARTWNLRLNLDELNALAMSLFSDQERIDAFQGLVLGCNAGTLPEQCSNGVRRSFDIGLGWRHEAEEFRDRKSKGGKASVDFRREKFGTAQPSNSVRTEPEQCSNQSTIHNPLILNPSIDKPEEQSPSAPVVPLKAKKPKEKKVRITALKPDSIEAFNEAWACIPPTRRVIDKIINDWVNEPVPKGSRFKAEENFQAIVDSGHATPYELYAAIHAYVNEDANVKKGFYQHVSTFYGPEKATWIQWMERAKQLVAEAQ